MLGLLSDIIPGMIECDVAIIGGGPAGSTVATLLKKYDPSIDIAIFEADQFPRHHVGESQLPVITQILAEMGVWDKVEAADFPVKVGATFRWGLLTDDELWDFNFLPVDFKTEPRPAKLAGQRIATAFQVDRSIYDKILLDHCREIGCHVYEQTRVQKVERNGEAIDHLMLKSSGPAASELGESNTVKAKYYVDGSGVSAIVRKAFDIGVVSPTSLRNIAIYDYWQNAEWARKIGVGGTYIQIMSLGWGWLWFIPITPTRTSIGLVTSAEYYKKSGMSTEALYLKAIGEEPRINPLVQNAMREGLLHSTTDWSYLVDRTYGDNWFLVGDACGFADPILSAGMSLAHMSGRRVAFSILELMKGDLDAAWIKEQYSQTQRKNIANHIRFADYWYSANSKMSDLREYCSQIAKDAGLTLEADAAFHWLGTGGFADEISGVPFAGSYRISAMKDFTERFSGVKGSWHTQVNNVFELDTAGATEGTVAVYERGKVLQVPCLVRDGKTLPMHLMYGVVYAALQAETEIQLLAERFMFEANKRRIPPNAQTSEFCTETLEALVVENWVKASYDPKLPLLKDYPKGT